MSLNDLAGAVSEFAIWMDVFRFAAPTIVAGRVQESPKEKRIRVHGSLQPLTGKELQLLPEGMRNQGVMVLFTKTKLLTVSTSECKLPDEVRHGGVCYEVTQVDDWGALGNYYRVLLTRRNR
jgi:hypothetical protein